MATALKLPDMVTVPENVMEAAIKKMEQDAHIIRALKTKNERLKEEKLEAELEASTEIAKYKFALANSVQRIADLEKAVDRIANHQQGLVTREEFKLLESEHYALSGRVPV